jgi:hypothetical protein
MDMLPDYQMIRRQNSDLARQKSDRWPKMRSNDGTTGSNSARHGTCKPRGAMSTFGAASPFGNHYGRLGIGGAKKHVICWVNDDRSPDSERSIPILWRSISQLGLLQCSLI